MSPSTLQRVNMGDFYCAKSENGKVNLYVRDIVYTLNKKLIELEDGLKSFSVVRVSRDCLVALEKIEKIREGKLYFTDNQLAPVKISRQYKPLLIDSVRTFLLAP